MTAQMDARLNVFSPYERSVAWHENQLTRALLVVLRYSPICHQAWLNLAAPGRNLYDLETAEFATQRGRVLNSKAVVPEGDAVTGISVLLAPDAPEINQAVQESDRQQILDGIVTYGNSLVVVIENKITISEVTPQPYQINLHGSRVNFATAPQPVKWQVLLGAMLDLVQRELISGAERLLVSDFLDFVEQNFPQVGPDSTLRRCGDNTFRLDRRLDSIQGKVIGSEAGRRGGWRDIDGTERISMAWLGLATDNPDVCLRLYPGDTLTQSRAFYSDPVSVAGILALQADNWSIRPNFHWGFMQRGYAWIDSPLPVDQYCDYWIQEISNTREMQRTEWEDYWSTLEAAHIVDSAGKLKFDAEFTAKGFNKAHPRPGLCCEYRWSLEDAKMQDDLQGRFVALVRERVNQLLGVLGAQPIIGAED